MKKIMPQMYLDAFSRKQQKAALWWLPDSPHKDARIMMAEGAIRSGKTMSMILSFFMWSKATFRNQHFILAGKTASSLRRNVVEPAMLMLESIGDHPVLKRSESKLLVGSNTFHLFGADTEAAQDKLQGMTAAGAYADEVALFPQSFVEQMIGRCSVRGSKIFMNCNPAGAYHFIKTEFIDKADQINMYRLHFIMDDNPSLSPEIRNSYASMFSGPFYSRYVLGEWTSAEGAIYPMWDDFLNTFDFAERFPENLNPAMYQGRDRITQGGQGEWMMGPSLAYRHYVAIDYGTSNPCVFLDVWDDGRTFWIVNEYYWDSVARRRQKTDSEYADDLVDFLGGNRDVAVIVDPSAASFKAELKNRGFRVQDADNEVRDGIAETATLIQQRKIMVEKRNCPSFLKEVHGYIWDDKATQRGDERPVKDHDHAMDALRYLVHTKTDRFRQQMA